MDREAKEAALIGLLDIYHTADRVTDAAYQGMVAALEPFSLDVVVRACAAFRGGAVEGHNNAFPPNEAQLVQVLRDFDAPAGIDMRGLASFPIGKVPPGVRTIGAIEADYGHGRINMVHLTPEQKDVVEHHKGVAADGRNMATMTPEELVAAVSVLALPSPEPKRPADIVPHLQRFNVDA